MSYVLSDGVTNSRALFFAYRSTAASNIGINTVIPFTDIVNTNYTSITGGVAPYVPSANTYVVAESRTSGDSSGTFNLVDCEIVENVGSKSEGYQVRNIAAGGAFMIDDATYGITQNTAINFKVVNGFSSDFDSNAYETRMMGVITQ